MPANASHDPSAVADSGPATRWHIVAAACAWLVPGLGHAVIGQRRRGLILGVTIVSLWTLGLLIGGISCIEMRSPLNQFRVPFLGQMLLAPSVAVERYHTHLRDRVAVELAGRRADSAMEHPPEVAALPLPDDPQPFYEPSYAHLNELGSLFTALAGMLNLLAIIDVLYRDPRTRARQANDASRAGSQVVTQPRDGDHAATRVPAVIPWILPALAWRPFIDPLHVERYWMLLLVPLVVAIAVVYKTIKLEDLSRLPREAAKLSAQIIAFMFLAAALLWLVVELV